MGIFTKIVETLGGLFALWIGFILMVIGAFVGGGITFSLIVWFIPSLNSGFVWWGCNALWFILFAGYGYEKLKEGFDEGIALSKK